jgi:hypothetical protein
MANIFPNPNDNNIPKDDIWFQQDGAPPPFGVEIRRLLDDIFANMYS